MACVSPLYGFLVPGEGPSGRRMVFKMPHVGAEPTTVPCGRCVGCRIEYAREWAARCMHERQLHEFNSYVTLTYAPDCLPPGGTLVHRDFQLFMKRLRRRSPEFRVSFFMCGEYGERTRRPHYHAILFGVDFPDQRFYKENAQGDRLYRSALLDEIWQLGECLVGAVSYESAAYVARYLMARKSGIEARRYALESSVVDPDTGEVTPLLPEYCKSSLRPAIGKGWFDEWKGDLYPSDFVVVQGKKLGVPRYYDKLLARERPELLEQLKAERKKKAERWEPEQRRDRREAREKVMKARLALSKREFES